VATIKQIRQRIKTSKNIQQITRAMKLVAAARLKKAQEKAVDARAYSEEMHDLMLAISSGADMPEHPLLSRPKEIRSYGLVLITADRGLAGSFNTNLLRTAQEFIKNQAGAPKLICIGKKGAQFFAKQDLEIIEQFSIASSGVKIQDAQKVTSLIRDKFEAHELDAVYVCYSKFQSAIRQTPQVIQLLPIVRPASSSDEKSSSISYQFEPDPKQLLESLLPRYLFTLVFQTLLESNASEHGARMTAMTSATDNAKKVIERLTLIANRERQAAITKEILEVVGGAEALAG
jgi:F-type H+-transporting ATPase subunit gamma